MKTIQQLRYAALIIALIMATGCKKSSNSGSGTTTNLLTSASWKETTTEWQTVAGVWISPASQNVLTLSFSTLTFFDNNTYLGAGGYTGTWKLSSDNSQIIVVTSNGKTSTMNVATLTATTLQLTCPLDNTYYTVAPGTHAITYYSTERDTYSH
jgi:hypothetical protein